VLNKHVLLSEILLNKLNVAFVTASESHSLDSLAIDGEVSHGGTVLGSHVSNGSTVSKGESLGGGSEELNEFTDNTTFAEHLYAGESQISSGSVLGEFTNESESDNLGKDHGDGLTEHDSLGFNTTDTPSGNSETINHSGVRVSSDDGVGVEESISVEDDASEVLQVDLMDNTRAWRNNVEVVEGL